MFIICLFHTPGPYQSMYEHNMKVHILANKNKSIKTIVAYP